MKLRTACILIVFTFFSSHINAQSFIALSSGVSVDINNESPFYAIPVTLRFKPFRRSHFFIEATQSIGFNRLSPVDAYTLSPQLSEHVALTEEIKFSSFSMGIGASIVLYTNKKENQFTLNLSTGISDQHYKVNFRSYDKINYEVLNPDVNQYISGLYASIAGVYNFHKRKQDMFVMLHLQSPSTSSYERYKFSYNKVAPLQLMFGYKLFYNKK
jgi:hypothetical protein